jgi:hypothetical protein
MSSTTTTTAGPSQEGLDALTASYEALAVGASPGRKAGIRKQIDAYMLSLELAGVEYQEWAPAGSSSSSAPAITQESTQEEITQAHKALLSAQSKGRSKVASRMGVLLDNLLKRSEQRSWGLVDPRKAQESAPKASKAPRKAQAPRKASKAPSKAPEAPEAPKAS